MIMRVEGIDGTRAESLVRIHHVLPMIHERTARRAGGVARVAYEPVRAVDVRACLPDVVWCCAGDDDRGAFALEELGCVHEVGVVRLDGFGDAAAEGGGIVSQSLLCLGGK